MGTSDTYRGVLGGVLLCSLVPQVVDGPGFLLFSCRVGRERDHGDGSTLLVTQQYCLASMVTWLSSTCISRHDLLPHIPSPCVSAVNSSPHPGIAPQSLNPRPSRRPLQETSVPVRCMAVARTAWFSFRLGCHRSAVSLSALNVSPLTQTIALVWDRTPGSVPLAAEGRSSPTNTPVFTPSSFFLSSFAWFYIFFSSGQVLLSALSRYSACTSESEGVFLVYPWRAMYLKSTYSSTTLELHTLW